MMKKRKVSVLATPEKPEGINANDTPLKENGHYFTKCVDGPSNAFRMAQEGGTPQGGYGWCLRGGFWEEWFADNRQGLPHARGHASGVYGRDKRMT